jgi:hypothetical protein
VSDGRRLAVYCCSRHNQMKQITYNIFWCTWLFHFVEQFSPRQCSHFSCFSARHTVRGFFQMFFLEKSVYYKSQSIRETTHKWSQFKFDARHTFPWEGLTISVFITISLNFDQISLLPTIYQPNPIIYKIAHPHIAHTYQTSPQSTAEISPDSKAISHGKRF